MCHPENAIYCCANPGFHVFALRFDPLNLQVSFYRLDDFFGLYSPA